jgi:site-specific recombinase XerD
MRKLGQDAAAIDNALIVMAVESAEALKPYGKTIRDALNFYLPHLKSLSTTVPFSVLATEFRTECNRRLTAKEVKGTRHVETLRETLNKLEVRFGETAVSQIDVEQLEEWLKGLTGFDKQRKKIALAIKTRNKHRGNASQIFRFAVRRRYIATNPISEIAKFRSPATEEDYNKVRKFILTAEKTEKLFRAAAPEIIPFLALHFFAGIRRATLEKLDWSEVHFAEKRVIVPGYKAKNDVRYPVNFSDNLTEWLRPYVRESGSLLAPSRATNRKGAVKGTPTDVGTRNQILEAARKAGIVLRSNAGRKTFISMHVAFHKNEAMTALEANTSVEKIRENYLDVGVTPEDAAKFWEIRPPTSSL